MPPGVAPGIPNGSHFRGKRGPMGSRSLWRVSMQAFADSNFSGIVDKDHRAICGHRRRMRGPDLYTGGGQPGMEPSNL